VEIRDESILCDSEAVAAVVTRSQAKREGGILAAEIDSINDLSVTNESETADAMPDSSFIDMNDIASLQHNTEQADKSRLGRAQKNDDSSHAFKLARQGKGN
jgi:hypothetical protein